MVVESIDCLKKKKQFVFISLKDNCSHLFLITNTICQTTSLPKKPRIQTIFYTYLQQSSYLPSLLEKLGHQSKHMFHTVTQSGQT